MGKKIIVFFFFSLGILIILLIFSLNNLLNKIAQDFTAPIHFKAGPNFRIAFIYQNNNSEFWKQVKRGALKAQRGQNAYVSFFEAVPGQEFQLADYLYLAIQAGYDGMIVHSEDERIVPLIQEAWNKGIPTIVVASDLPDSGRIGYVGTNNYRTGYVVGKTLLNSIKKRHKPQFAVITPMMLGTDTQTSVGDSLKVFGYWEAICSKGTNIPIWEKSDTTLLNSLKVVRNLIEQYPNLDGIYATYTEGTVAAARLVSEKNLINKIHIIGHGDSPEIRDYLRKTVIDASIVEYPYQIGLTAVKEMMGYLRENKINLSNNIDVIILNRNNLNNYPKTED